MTRHDDQRLTDIIAAAAAIADHTRRGGLDDGLVFDALRVIVRATVDNDVPPLVAAAERLLAHLADDN